VTDKERARAFGFENAPHFWEVDWDFTLAKEH
jgi:hypothetical protein